MTILVDHNMGGYATILWGALAAAGWLDLIPLQLMRFADVGLPIDSSDRTVWRFVQEKQMLLLTDNRNMAGEDSLERTLREETSPTTLPVLTIGRLDRLVAYDYRERCVTRLMEIILDLDSYLVVGRVFIP